MKYIQLINKFYLFQVLIQKVPGFNSLDLVDIK